MNRRNGSDESSSNSTSEEEPEESSAQVMCEDALSSFREKWQKELKTTPPKEPKTPEPEPGLDFETRAKNLFLNGIEMEKTGKLYEAIQFYRRAVQLVPDIETRLDNITKPKTPKEEITESDNDSSDSDDETSEFFARIQKKVTRTSTICVAKTEQKVQCIRATNLISLKSTHISALPTEMILYILRWVVSTDLDLRSLEMFSMVCRGFYLCARDPEIWRLACLRVWGLNCGNSPHNYLSWRQMFIERTRLHFNGCYIGKTTYIRHGENSFQDQFYRPWHLITYYRYLRFFPEGVVLVLTSSDEPSQCVNQLKNKNARNPILRGYYRLKDDKVTLVVHRENGKMLKKSKRRDIRETEQTFHMELQIKSINKKRHVQLVWTHYSVFTRNMKGDESTCNFDLVGNKFPPFWFSRVKSYTSESEYPLE